MTPRIWLLLGGVVLATACGVAWLLPAPASAVAAPPQKGTPQPRVELFPTGPLPELCIVLSGQMYGYLQPCGCARPQVGGLERRFELFQDLAARNIPAVGADLGDLAGKETGYQTRMKYDTALQMLQKMPYAALGIGSTELELTLDECLARALNYQPPVVLAANLQDPAARFPEMFKPFVVSQPKPGGLKVGFVGVLADSQVAKAKAKDSALVFVPAVEAIKKALAEMGKEKPDVLVLLCQGTVAEAEQLFRAFPDTFHVIQSRADADIASALPTRWKNPSGRDTLLINTGHKGRSVGLVAVNQANGGPSLRYQMVELVEGYELPDEKTNPVRDLMKDYVKAVYNEGLLTKVVTTQHPLQLRPGMEKAVFVGAAKCQQCHPTAHKTWDGSKHALGWVNLGKYGRPLAERQEPGGGLKSITRQFDPECASCHVTGFGYQGGFIDELKTPHLLGNQCENCHGPGSLHVATAKNANECDPKYAAPLRLNIADPMTEKKCRTCHDTDNDPYFDLKTYWPKIQHGKETGVKKP